MDRIRLSPVFWRMEPLDSDHVRVTIKSQRASYLIEWIGAAVPARVHRSRGLRAELVVPTEYATEAEAFLRFADASVPIRGAGFETWACEPHWREEGRSEWGRLLYRAKPYDGDGDRDAATLLGNRMADRILRHPGYCGSVSVVPVPDFKPKLPYALPQILAEVIAGRLGARLVPDAAVKVMATPQMKNLPAERRTTALRGAFRATQVLPQPVVVVDDVVQTAATITAVAEALRASGNASIRAVAATHAKLGTSMSRR